MRGISGIAGMALAALQGAGLRGVENQGNVYLGSGHYSAQYRGGGSRFDPRLNRNTGQPHQHRQEIARRTTAPGTSARRAAMEAARG